MIFFKKLRWKNLLSTGNIFTEIDLSKTNTTLIVGENGAGKSTILDALTYSLFGKPFRKINKPQLLNTITRKECLVEIEFDIGSNQYKVVRGLKPTIFQVYQNNILMNQSAEMKDYQEILEKQILKINHKSFCQVVVLGSANFQPFMQLSVGQRREIIEDLLDLQIFTTMNSLLKDKIQSNNEELVSIGTDEKVILEKIDIIQEHLLEKQNSNEKIVAEKVEMIEDTNIKINLLNEDFWVRDKELAALNEKLEDEHKSTKRIEQLSQLRHKIAAKRGVINEDLQFFKDHEGCPTCKQVIAEDFKNKTVEEKNSQLLEIDNALKDLVREYNETNDKIKEYVAIHTELNSKHMAQVKNRATLDSLVKYRNQLDFDINKINEVQDADEETKMEQLQDELESVVNRYNVAMDQKQIYTAAAMLLKDGGIKARIIKQYVPVINKLINKYLSAMDFFVQFELDEEFNETIKSRFRDEFSYASFSEGEKMRINLAILFTWRAVAKLRNSVSTNLLIMDEVFDSSLDSNGTDEFLKIINNLTSDNNTFIISHKTDQMYDKFANVIKFEKHKNFSKVV